MRLEIREDDKRTTDLIRFLNHKPTEVAVSAERAFLRTLEGGCQVPIGGYAYLEGENLILTGMVDELDGSRIIKDNIKGFLNRPEEAGISLAERLLSSGADNILARIYGKG